MSRDSTVLSEVILLSIRPYTLGSDYTASPIFHRSIHGSSPSSHEGTLFLPISCEPVSLSLMKLSTKRTNSQHRAQCEVGIRHITTHHDNAIPIRRVLVQDGSKEIELLPDRGPCLFTLMSDQSRRNRCMSSAMPVEMGLAALRQALMREGDNDRKQRLDEGVLDVVDKQGLECTRTLGKDGAGGVRRLEVFSDGVDIGKNDGGIRGSEGVNDDGESIDRTAVRSS